MTVYVPGSGEKDIAKVIMSLTAVAGAQVTDETNIATNTTSIAALNAATYVNSFKTRTGVVSPAQGDYPTNLIPGTATNDNATAGNIGEYITSTVASNAVALTSGNAANATSISLTAGDWDVSGNVFYVGAASTTVSYAEAAINTTSATRNQANSGTFYAAGGTYFGSVNGSGFTLVAPTTRVSISSTTTVYLIAFMNFGASTATAGGTIRARRVR